MDPEWFLLDNIPYDEMWEDDVYWMPKMFDGEDVYYTFYFDHGFDLFVY